MERTLGLLPMAGIVGMEVSEAMEFESGLGLVEETSGVKVSKVADEAGQLKPVQQNVVNNLTGELGLDPNLNIKFAQPDYSQTFGQSVNNPLQKQSIDEVAAQIKLGKITPTELPIHFVEKDGIRYIYNTRSSVAVIKSGKNLEDFMVNVERIKEENKPLYQKIVSKTFNQIQISPQGFLTIKPK